MKTLHVTTTDYGGAYRATQRINYAMQQKGIDSCVLVRSKFNDETDVIEAFHSPIAKLISKIKNVGNLFFSKGEIISDLFGTDITMSSSVKEADIIFLHWVNSFISYGVVKKLLKLNKPIIWVMHDMWVFTGGCHIDKYCGKYREECGKCPIIRSSKDNDISYYNVIQKKRIFKESNIVFVGPSRWMVQSAQESSILKHQKVIRIPNPINTDIFRPLEKKTIRKKYNIPEDKKVIMFGALKATENSNKGIKYLISALEILNDSQYIAIVFGNENQNSKIERYIETKYVGIVKDDDILSEIYNIADVFVAPSEQDNYANTVLEALSCGIPVTAFNIGGMPDMIENKQNGYLAEFRNSKDLLEGIRYCCDNTDLLGNRARERVLENNSYSLIGNEYVELCLKLLEKDRDGKQGN
ncbi:MAG: glycosyltransferase [Lachnospiraceae bacterium]|nr:glycosyltransferase [Lachnospiraceae bacterium]